MCFHTSGDYSGETKTFLQKALKIAMDGALTKGTQHGTKVVDFKHPEDLEVDYTRL